MYLRIEDVAEMFQISRSEAFRLKKEQGWPSHRFGRSLRFSPEDIKAIAEMHFEAPKQTPTKQTPKRPNVGTKAKRNQR